MWEILTQRKKLRSPMDRQYLVSVSGNRYITKHEIWRIDFLNKTVQLEDGLIDFNVFFRF